MWDVIGYWFAGLALVGVVIALSQYLAVVVAHRRPTLAPPATPGISILKPLCGIDDDLEANLECFANLDYPDYEVLLGVRSRSDEAWAVAKKVSRRWPHRFRVVRQQGEWGFNPKVNQLITLERQARHPLLVISDSNVRVGRGYLSEIAAHLANPAVGLVTHPTAGIGERRLGSLLDNLHMTAGIGAGMIAAKTAAGQDLVVGKSMALRRDELQAMGGFESVKDVLAEDFVMGRRTTAQLGLKVVVAKHVVFNVSQQRRLKHFHDRFKRWSVMQHAAVGPLVYLSQALLNPLPLAVLALMCAPSSGTGLVLLGTLAARTALDGLSASRLRPGGFSWRQLAFVPLKDLVLFSAWLHGLVNHTVVWRGTRLQVTEGTVLVPLSESATQATPVVARAA